MIAKSRFPRVVAVYVLWLVILALSAGLFLVWRTALIQLYLRAGLDRWAFRFFDDVVTLTLGLAWLILAIVLESWFRGAAAKGRLRRTAIQVLAVEAGALVVGYLISIWA